MRRATTVFVSLIFSGVALISCGGSSLPTTPAESTTSQTVTSTQAATISGSVANSSSSLSAGSTSGATTGLAVTVTGTSASASVDGAGRFVLTNVPAGTVELHFTGPGVDARVVVGTVSTGDVLEIHITLAGTTARVEDSDRSHDGSREIEGLVSAVPPTTPAATFKVAGTLVTTTLSTEFKLNGHTGLFANLIVGARVHVKGMVTSTGVTATEVNIQNDQPVPPSNPGNDHDGQIELSGAVAGMTGACPVIRFSLGSDRIVTNASTKFDPPCDHVSNAVRVEVQGTRGADGVVTATRVKKD